MSSANTPGMVPGVINTPERQPKGTDPEQGSMTVQHSLPGADDRRRFQRANVPLLGRFMRQNREEYPCQIVNVSAGGLAVKAMVTLEPHEHLVLYIDTLGRIEGKVARTFQDGFALELTASGYKREKIANQLTWLVNKDKLSSIDDRKHDRFAPRNSKAKLTLEDETVLDCEIVDISLGGAAVIVEPAPETGQLVILGFIRGQVVRHSGNTVSIQFADIQDPATIERQFG